MSRVIVRLGWAAAFLAVTVAGVANQVQAASQSPIDIRSEDTVYDPTIPSLNFNYSTNASLDLYNNGSPGIEASIKANVQPGVGSVTVNGVQYNLLQFHFHTEAEHLINGVRGAMEMHFVHQSTGGELLVVGQIINIGAYNAALDPIFSNLPQTSGSHVAVNNFNIAALLPNLLQSFRYDGSLTTAPYTEGVKWNVLAAETTMSQAQVDAFRALFPNGDSREEQDLDGRTIVTDLKGFVPEPSTYVLALLGAVPALVISRRRKVSVAA